MTTDTPHWYDVTSGSEATQVLLPVFLTQGTRATDWIGERLVWMNRALATSVGTLADAPAAITDPQPNVYDVADTVDAAQRLSTRATVATPPWREYVLGRLVQMLIEGEGRDAYPDASVITRSWSEVTSLFGPHTPTPSIVPTEDGGVAFVWHKKGWDVEIAVDPAETTVWAHRRSDGTKVYGPLAVQRGRLVELLSEMAST